jgi:hypothetical protein
MIGGANGMAAKMVSIASLGVAAIFMLWAQLNC